MAIVIESTTTFVEAPRIDTFNVALPTGTQVGDVLVMVLVKNDNANPVSVDRFTLGYALHEISGPNVSTSAWYVGVTQADLDFWNGSVNVLGDSEEWVGVLYRLSGVDTSNIWDDAYGYPYSSGTSSINTSPFNEFTPSPGSHRFHIIGFDSDYTDALNPPSGWSLTYMDTDSKDTRGYFHESATEDNFIATLSDTIPLKTLIFSINAASSGGDSLTAQDLTSSTPTIEQATLSQTYSLSSNEITSNVPTLTQSNISQDHSFSSQEITSGVPTIQQANASALNELTAQEITNGAPTFDDILISQNHEFTSQGILGGAPTLDLATLAQAHILSINDLASEPVLALTSLSQNHSLSSQGIYSGIPTVESPSLTETNQLDSQEIITMTAIEQSNISQNHLLSSQDIVSSAQIEGPSLPKPSKTILVSVLSSQTYPELTFYATDPEGGDLEYTLQIDTVNTFDSINLVEAHSEADAGFENVDTPADVHPFNAGDHIKYTVQQELDQGVTYYWRVRAGAVI